MCQKCDQKPHYELRMQIANHANLEEFYHKRDIRGNGRDSYMQQYHKNRRLELEREYKDKTELVWIGYP